MSMGSIHSLLFDVMNELCEYFFKHGPIFHSCKQNSQRLKFVIFIHIIYDQTLLIRSNIAVTYPGIQKRKIVKLLVNFQAI